MSRRDPASGNGTREEAGAAAADRAAGAGRAAGGEGAAGGDGAAGAADSAGAERAAGRFERFDVAVSPAYTVHVGPGALSLAPELAQGRRVALVADETSYALHGEPVEEALRDRGLEVHPLVVPPGEGSKSAATWAGLLERMAGVGFGRDDSVLALGGGVVGDLGGFVAASYMRGIAFVQAPTTLLAMADAAIGGKTGINLPEGKNLVGAFWQPRGVLMDVTTLRTLPERILHQGSVEVFKHGLLADPALARAVLDGAFAPDAPTDDLTRWVAASGRVKAEVVAADAHEHGLRAHLNLGHTLAHALESVSRHRLSHGEAVAWGLLYAAHLSRLLGGADWTDLPRSLLMRVRPAPLPTAAWEDVAPYLRRDKKNRGGRQRWVLLSDVAAPYLSDEVDEEQERAAWRALVRDAGDAPAGPEGGTP